MCMEGRLGGEAELAAGPLGVGSPCRAPFPRGVGQSWASLSSVSGGH